MKRPAIAVLSPNQRKGLITEIEKDKTDFRHKETTIGALNFVDELLEELKTSKIKNINELKKILEVKSENIKKLKQNH